ncbi:MAG: septum formation protein Maf [Clostridia bacterium]|nr:septum formation protein Maf [Clostridia bacterium]
MEIILASASPRRRELIGRTGVNFTVVPSSFDECVEERLSPEEYVRVLAEKKAEDVFSKRGGVVLGADTVVILDGEIIGKPSSRDDAIKTLSRLSGRRHEVITGYCVIYGDAGKKKTGFVTSSVYFNELPHSLIEEYVATGSCMDKAGSYGVQDGFPLVKKVEGSLSNVIGLPVEKLTEVFKEIENEQYQTCH